MWPPLRNTNVAGPYMVLKGHVDVYIRDALKDTLARWGRDESYASYSPPTEHFLRMLDDIHTAIVRALWENTPKVLQASLMEAMRDWYPTGPPPTSGTVIAGRMLDDEDDEEPTPEGRST